MPPIQKPDLNSEFELESYLPPSSEEPEPVRSPQSASRVIPKWLIYVALGCVGLGLALLTNGTISQGLEYGISLIENSYQEWFAQQDTTNPIILLPLAFVGGLLASVSPCILALLPVNLSYIGTRNITSRRDAFVKAGLFVLGNVIILSLFGLVSSFAGFVIVEYRGYINVIVGAIILLMGISLMGLIRLPLPGVRVDGSNFGSFGVGLTFALVSSPCASPVLFAVLAAAGASGSQLLSVLTMTSYALGYTIIIFLSSLLAGFAKQARLLLQHSEMIIKFGSVALIVAGIYYVYSGITWFLG